MVVVVVVEIDIIFHAVAQAEDKVGGTSDIFIQVPHHISTHSPLERAAAGRRAVRPGFLGRRRRGDGARLVELGLLPLTWLREARRRRRRAVYVPVGERSPQRGHGRAVYTVSTAADAEMAAAMAQAACSVTAAAVALARCHIFQHVQRSVTHALVVVLIVKLLLSGGECPHSLRGLPDVHP